MSSSKTIYERLGDENLRLLVDEFYTRVFASPIIGKLFAASDPQLVRDKQVAFLTQFLGGPPRFNETFGPPRMRLRHAPHAIDRDAMQEWLKLMKAAIQELPISTEFKESLYLCFPKLAQHMVNR